MKTEHKKYVIETKKNKIIIWKDGKKIQTYNRVHKPLWKQLENIKKKLWTYK